MEKLKKIVSSYTQARTECLKQPIIIMFWYEEHHARSTYHKRSFKIRIRKLKNHCERTQIIDDAQYLIGIPEYWILMKIYSGIKPKPHSFLSLTFPIYENIYLQSIEFSTLIPKKLEVHLIMTRDISCC